MCTPPGCLNGKLQHASIFFYLSTSFSVLEIMAPLPPDSDVEGGSIIRDASGEPTGLYFFNAFTTMPLRLGAGIFVDNAMTLIPRPPWAPEQYVNFFNTVVEEALKFGLTSIHDASTDPDAVAFFKGFVILDY
jgi:predicted amidohydrolase YtcJ